MTDVLNHPSSSRIPTIRLVAGFAAIAGTLPYLTLKAHWLSGGLIGISDPAQLSGPEWIVLNAITFGLDAVAILLALALTFRWGLRLPAWLVLVPMWVGTGFLVPIALGLPALLLSSPSPGGSSPLEPWVQPLVYGGFGWQGAALIVAFVLYTRQRWADTLRGPLDAVAPRPATQQVLRVFAAGAAGLAVLVAISQAARAAGAAGLDGALVESLHALLALVGAAGALALVHRRPLAMPLWTAVAAAWVGSAAMFSWGLYMAGNTAAGTALSAADPVGGLTALGQLMAGLVLGLVALVSLVERRTGAVGPR